MLKEKILELGLVLSEKEVNDLVKLFSEEIKETIPKVEHEEVVKEKERLEGEVKDRDKQLDTLKTSVKDVEDLKGQIESLQADYKAKEEAHVKAVEQMKIDSAVELAINNAKAKNSQAVRGMLDLSLVKLDEKGAVVGLEEQFKKLTKDESTAFLFESTKVEMRGATPSASAGGAKGVTKEDFNKMSYKERNELYNSDLETYNSLAGSDAAVKQ